MRKMAARGGEEPTMAKRATDVVANLLCLCVVLIGAACYPSYGDAAPTYVEGGTVKLLQDASVVMEEEKVIVDWYLEPYPSGADEYRSMDFPGHTRESCSFKLHNVGEQVDLLVGFPAIGEQMTASERPALMDFRMYVDG